MGEKGKEGLKYVRTLLMRVRSFWFKKQTRCSEQGLQFKMVALTLLPLSTSREILLIRRTRSTSIVMLPSVTPTRRADAVRINVLLRRTTLVCPLVLMKSRAWPKLLIPALFSTPTCVPSVNLTGVPLGLALKALAVADAGVVLCVEYVVAALAVCSVPNAEKAKAAAVAMKNFDVMSRSPKMSRTGVARLVSLSIAVRPKGDGTKGSWPFGPIGYAPH